MTLLAGHSKALRYKAPENPRSEAYTLVRRCDEDKGNAVDEHFSVKRTPFGPTTSVGGSTGLLLKNKPVKFGG
jgi:hypothetical protein